MSITVQIYTEGLIHNFGLPQYESQGAAGLDIRANEYVALRPGETRLVKTGLFVAIPIGYELQVRPRSGLSLKSPFRVANAPGTVDSDYRGEICVIGQNTSDHEIFNVGIGDRIAQLVLQQVPQLVWEPVQSKEDLGSTQRGERGFGSSGK